MRRMTDKERTIWARAKRHGYASYGVGGVRLVLTIDKETGATVLVPLHIIALEL